MKRVMDDDHCPCCGTYHSGARKDRKDWKGWMCWIRSGRITDRGVERLKAVLSVLVDAGYTIGAPTTHIRSAQCLVDRIEAAATKAALGHFKHGEEIE